MRESRQVGIESIESVFVMENHDEAYRIWRDAGVRQATLVHVDAHHDMWWNPEPNSLTIADFICPALKDDLIRQVFWVVPDRTWERRKSRKAVLRHLREVVAGYPGTPQAGDVITGAEQPGVIHAGTRRREDGAIVAAGGRVLSVTAVGSDLSEARRRAYELVQRVQLPGGHYRSDIALRAELHEITI